MKMPYGNVALLSVVLLSTLALTQPIYAAGDPMDKAMTPLIERLKSRDAAERSAAVGELQALRSAVAFQLADTVMSANQGLLPETAKTSALYLIGELRLAQCFSVARGEKDWQPSSWAATSDKEFAKIQPGKVAYEGSLTQDGVQLRQSAASASLSSCPPLAAAVRDIKSSDFTTVDEAEDLILRWYDVVCKGMLSALGAGEGTLYSDDVRASAAFMLGEFRYRKAVSKLAEHITLTDENRVSAGFPAVLEVSNADPSRPCQTALIKIGILSNAVIDRIAGGYVPDDGIRLAAEAALRMEPEKAREWYKKRLLEAQNPSYSRGPDAAARLESVADVFR